MGKDAKGTQRVPKHVSQKELYRSFTNGEFLWSEAGNYYGEQLRTYQDLKRDIESYNNYYNNKSIKQKLAGISPVQYRIHTSQLTT